MIIYSLVGWLNFLHVTNHEDLIFKAFYFKNKLKNDKLFCETF